MGIPARVRSERWLMTKRRHESHLAPALGEHGDTEEEGEGRGIIQAVSCWLQDMARYYDSLEWTVTSSGLQRTEAFPVSAFHGRPLSSSIEDFVKRICTCADLDESVVLVAAVYLSRVLEKAGGKLPVSSCTVHRLLLQAMTISAKFVLDHPRSNKAMAALADIPVNKFNQLEVKFLCAIQYDLAVSPADMQIAKDALQLVAPVHKKRKVLNNSNSCSSVGGVAARNNSQCHDGVENTFEEEEEVTNNYSATLEGAESILGAHELPTAVMDSMAMESTSTTHSPEWSRSSGCTTDAPQIDSKLLPVVPMAQPTTQMSTPERRDTYSMALVATAAE